MTTEEKIEIMNHYLNNGLVGYKYKDGSREGVLTPYLEPEWNWEVCDFFKLDNDLAPKIKETLDNFDFEKIEPYAIIEYKEGLTSHEILVEEATNLLNKLYREEYAYRTEVFIKSKNFALYKNKVEDTLDIILSFLYSPIKVNTEMTEEEIIDSLDNNTEETD